MKYGTGAMFIELGITTRNILPTVSCPFMILHDPEDQVCTIRGSRNLMEQSQTEVCAKSLVELPGGYHVLVATKLEDVCGHIISWFRKAE